MTSRKEGEETSEGQGSNLVAEALVQYVQSSRFDPYSKKRKKEKDEGGGFLSYRFLP
jgi:hypothetical protein